MTTQQDSKLFILQAVDGDQQLPVDRQLVMGRNPASDVVLDQGGASREHAKLTPHTDGVWVEDSGSTNGTFVNGVRIEEACLLKEGDQLKAGESTFTLIAHEPVAEHDPDATLLYDASPVSDATMMADTGSSSEPSVSEPAAEKEAPDTKAPPSWVLNNQQSVDGTAFFSRDSLPDSIRNSGDHSAPVQEVGEPTLIGNSDPVVGLRFQLIGDDKSQWEIGRSPSSDVMLNHESVSGAHAQIINEGGRWKVVDLMSANGTYTNGTKCLTGYLSSGDVVCFGSVECSFILPQSESMQQQTPTAGTETSQAGAKNSTSSFKTAATAFAVTALVAGIVLFVIVQFV